MKIFVILFFLSKFPLIKEAEAFPAKKRRPKPTAPRPAPLTRRGPPAPYEYVRCVRKRSEAR
jgi:hypothetical protein